MVRVDVTHGAGRRSKLSRSFHLSGAVTFAVVVASPTRHCDAVPHRRPQRRRKVYSARVGGTRGHRNRRARRVSLALRGVCGSTVRRAFVSGFAGIIRLEADPKSLEQDREIIGQMARAIAFRGPDALQQTLQPGASFAFSLLKTGPAPQETSQPCTLNGEAWFLGDVRCDGREELKQELLHHGVELPASPSS